MIFTRFVARLKEINNFLSVSPISDATKKIPTEELNDILLHEVPNGWDEQAYL